MLLSGEKKTFVSKYTFTSGTIPITCDYRINKSWNGISTLKGNRFRCYYQERKRPLSVSTHSLLEQYQSPAIIELIRAGMVFQLKREIGLDVIIRREEDLCQ